MNRLRQLCLAAVLTLPLSLSASAGEIECGVTATPPQATNATPPATGDEAGGVEAVLNVVLGVLALL